MELAQIAYQLKLMQTNRRPSNAMSMQPPPPPPPSMLPPQQQRVKIQASEGKCKIIIIIINFIYSYFTFFL